VDADDSFGGCIYEFEAARAMIQKTISEELERVSAEIEPKIDAALKEHLIEPLCREFAPN
jgi:LPS O-antigen subunit length determinant protein (WzzB/FepE family)